MRKQQESSSAAVKHVSELIDCGFLVLGGITVLLDNCRACKYQGWKVALTGSLLCRSWRLCLQTRQTCLN